MELLKCGKVNHKEIVYFDPPKSNPNSFHENNYGENTTV